MLNTEFSLEADALLASVRGNIFFVKVRSY